MEVKINIDEHEIDKLVRKELIRNFNLLKEMLNDMENGKQIPYFIEDVDEDIRLTQELINSYRKVINDYSIPGEDWSKYGED